MTIKTTFAGFIVVLLGWNTTMALFAQATSSESDQAALLAQAKAGTADEAAMRHLLEASLKLDDLDTAIAWGRKAVDAHPDNPWLKIHLADALQRNMNRNPMTWMTGKGEYIELLEAAIALNPKLPEPYYFLNGFYLNAPGFVGGSVEKALDVAQRLRQHDEIEGGLALAQVYVAQEEEQAWRGTYLSLLKKSSDPDIHYQFGMALQGIQAYGEALMQFSKAADQDHLESLYQSGRTRVLGAFQWQQAIDDFDRFLERAEGSGHPLTAGAWWRKGQAYEALNQLDQARTCFEKAVHLRPDMKQAKKDLDRVLEQVGG